MKKQGEYYNPEYPDTSDYWTRKWHKSWLLNKDLYLLHRASEVERRRAYRLRMFFRLILSLLLLYLLVTILVTDGFSNLNIFAFGILLILAILIIFKWVDKILLVATIVICFSLSYLLLDLLFEYPFFEYHSQGDLLLSSIFYFIFLIEGIACLIRGVVYLTQGIVCCNYLYNLFSLKEFDKLYFCKIYDKLNELHHQKREVKDLIISKDMVPNFLLRLGYNLSLVGIVDYLVSCINFFRRKKKTESYAAFSFRNKFMRLSSTYIVLYKLRPEWFDLGKFTNKPKQRLGLFCSITSLVSTLHIVLTIISVLMVILLLWLAIIVPIYSLFICIRSK